MDTSNEPNATNIITPPSLPKGGGAIRGIGEKFGANPVTGTGSMTIPIITSPGRSGFGPQLSLSYDTGVGNGPFGLGWSLQLSSISRKTDKGLPQYCKSDVFILSGSEDLVPGKVMQQSIGNAPYRVQLYRPRVDDLFARIEEWTNYETGKTHWKSVTKDNISTLYGKTNTSQIFDPDDSKRVFTWLICESTDDRGNSISYEYAEENDEGVNKSYASERNRACTANRYIKRIKYGNQALHLNYMFEVVFDYGEHDQENPKPRDTGIRRVRSDPFSSYRSGFEVRTYRLCHRILMFHHFPEKDVGPNCLVRSTNFTYSCSQNTGHAQESIYSLLLSTRQTGYKCHPDGSYIHKSMPSIDLSYSETHINEQVQDVDQESLDNLPFGLDLSKCQWIDLNGEGLPGIIMEQGNEWFYKQNVSPISNVSKGSKRIQAKFTPTKLVYNKPTGSSDLQFTDLAGDGRIDLVNFHNKNPGFYKRAPNDNWENFVSFKSLPILDWHNQNIRFIDLNGDGHNDILVSEADSFTWYQSLAEEGFSVARKIYQQFSKDKGSHILFSDTTQSIHLADMSGDGLTDIVRVCNGETCYWPNIGYGNFGAKIIMDKSPNFDSVCDFDPKRMKLMDIDGSGTADILYINRSGKVQVYFNQSGNSWSTKRVLHTLPVVDNTASVTVLDLLGSGTACLVWSSFLPGNACRTIRYIDLMGGNKPHLLTKYTNNMGSETVIEYEPSTKDYLQDKIAGTPWITKIPFPVHVVRRVKIYDTVSKSRLVTRYTYHHGYFDGKEREFRGFGRVDKWDTEEIGTTLGGSNLEVPPVLTKTWFHTGAYLDSDKVCQQLAHEYYQKQGQGSLLSGGIMPPRLTIEEEREAARALKGRVLRQEIYALDGSDKQHYPYSVSELNYAICLQQKIHKSCHSVFSVHSNEMIDHHYERNPNDPRVTHAITLEVDEFNNVLKSIAIAYPRSNPVYHEQSKILITYTENRITNKTCETDWYRVGVPIESSTYEITGLPFCKIPFTRNFICNQLPTASEIAYEETANHYELQKRLIERVRTLYRKDKEAGSTDPTALPLGEVDSLALPCESYKLAFTEGILCKTYSDKLSPNDLHNTLKYKGKYVQHCDDTNYWWVSSGRQAFDPDRFYLPIRFKDQFDNTYTTSYDSYSLAIVQTTDPLGNVVHIQNDYRTMLPKQITDYNGNASSVISDALGMVVGSAIMGKESDAQGDSFSVFKEDLSDDEVKMLFSTEDPRPLASSYLGTATTRIIYDLDTTPVCAAAIVRETHVSSLDEGQLTKIQLSFVYSDGLGRELQTKTQAEPDPADSSPRWVGTGTKVYNNKGKIVRQYEPFFSRSQKPGVEQWGVSNTLFYDPIDRLVATLHPNHTYEKVVFDSWQQKTYDTNDTVILYPRHDTDVGHFFKRLPEEDYLPTWYQERINGDLGDREKKSAEKAAKHAMTPAVSYFDTLGRTFLTVVDNGEGQKYRTHIELDIEANERTVRDALDRTTAKRSYNMLGSQVHQANMEAGNRWILNGSTGKPIFAWDDRHHTIRTTYDALQRQTGLFVKTGNDPEVLAERTIYGEELGNADNHRGRVYQHFDGSGVTTNTKFDFKGNLTRSEFKLSKSYKTIPDWFFPNLETEIFSSCTSYDALNRPVQIVAPHSNQSESKFNVIRPSYNEANLLERIDVWLEETAEPTYLLKQQTANFQAVTDINRNAKGQRTLIRYGNGTVTKYAYDSKTFRMTNMNTKYNNNTLQNLLYTYDPVGNITHIQDNAQQTIFFRNQVVQPHSDYIYDSIYRLIEASGREHANTANQYETTLSSKHNIIFCHSDNGQEMQKYKERYLYDAVGNFDRLIHQAARGSWTRSYSYDEPSQIEEAKQSNRLSSTKVGDKTERYTYDAHGNITRMPHLASMQWDYKDQLCATSRQITLPGRAPETTYYTYNSSSQRVRKITEFQDGTCKGERIYLGVFEIYREFKSSESKIKLERETLHITDDQQMIALIETKTITNLDDESPTQSFRFQLNNHLGSAVLELNNEANIISYEEYYPYGNTSYKARSKNIKAVAKRYRYTGKERDEENGFYYHGARYYAPWLGRWTACDPELWQGKTEQPYAYVENRPTVAYDPDGRAINLIAAAIGAGVGAVLGGGFEAGRQLITDRSTPLNWNKIGASAVGGALSGGLAGLTAGASLLVEGAAATGAAVVGGVATRAVEGEKQTLAAVGADAFVGLATLGVIRGGSSLAKAVMPSVGKLNVAARLALRGVEDVQQGARQTASFEVKQAVQQVEKQAEKQVAPQVEQQVEQQAEKQVVPQIEQQAEKQVVPQAKQQAEEQASRASPTVQENRAVGTAFENEIADAFRRGGPDYKVEQQVYKWTPFGKRFIDIQISFKDKVLGGIETKVGNSRYTTLQRLKDHYLLHVEGYRVNVVREPRKP